MSSLMHTVKRLAVVTTHPIQYNAPLFKMLAQSEQLKLKVFYTSGESTLKKFDHGFGKYIEWNIPVLEGYEYTFVKNVAKKPGSHHFSGIDNPGLIDEIESWRPSAILLYGWSFKSHLQVLRYFHKKTPILFRGDSTLLNRKGFVKKFVRKQFLKWVYQHVDYALYVGTNNKAYFLAHGLKPDQLVFVPHAVDNDRFLAASALIRKNTDAWKESNGISPEDTLFLFAGKLDHNKNVSLLI
ncbi:MAG: glycosyltransferase family 1 protein, partial [Chitinophagaceae bacterium]